MMFYVVQGWDTLKDLHVTQPFIVVLKADKFNTLAGPIILGNINEEHPSGLCPSSINGVWNVALSEA